MSEEKKNEILEEKVNSEELDAVSGGGMIWAGDPGPDRHGSCSKNYFAEKCSATVENGSHCWTNDYCSHFSEKYNKKK